MNNNNNLKPKKIIQRDSGFTRGENDYYSNTNVNQDNKYYADKKQDDKGKVIFKVTPASSLKDVFK